MNIIIPVMGFGRAGGYRVLSKLSDCFVNAGHTVKFITPSFSATPYYPTKAEVIKVNVAFGSVPIIRVLSSFFSLLRAIRKIDGDLIIANHYLTAYLAFFSPSCFKKFYYIQAYEVKLVSNIFLKALAYCSYLLPLLKVVNSDKILPSNIKKVVGVVPAGIDLNLFNAKKCESKRIFNESKIYIGCIGRVEKYKGTLEILNAFEKVLNHYNVFLNIAVHMPKINPRLSDNIAFYEISNDKNLADFYRSNHIFVATGLVEDGAFHYPCAESMASGCVVISNYAPLTDRADSCNMSLRLSEVNADNIEQAIKFALNIDSKDIENELKINADVVSLYDWERVSTQFLDIITFHLSAS